MGAERCNSPLSTQFTFLNTLTPRVLRGVFYIDISCRMVYHQGMFNLQHILYMAISGGLTVLILLLAGRFARDSRSRNFVLQFSAISTVVIHYSNLWVNFFLTGGNALIENNHILPVYPCNVVMWMLLAAALIRDKKSVAFQLLGEFCFYGGIVCGVIGIVLNANFGTNPSLADYDILKGMLSHSTMLLGCIYLRTGGFIRIRVFNAVSVAAGLGCFVICGVAVDGLYALCGMTPPDGMFLRSNPYLGVSPILLGCIAVVLLFAFLALWELRLPRQDRWYEKLRRKRNA